MEQNKLECANTVDSNNEYQFYNPQMNTSVHSQWININFWRVTDNGQTKDLFHFLLLFIYIDPQPASKKPKLI